jgi:hypothetical protein
VQVHYVKRLQDGATFSSREPLALTVGIEHQRLPGLGTALVGPALGQATTWTVPPELAYGLADATRIRRWSRKRFPKEATLRVGKFQRFMDERGRRRLVRSLEVQSNVVVVDTNHRGAGQSPRLPRPWLVRISLFQELDLRGFRNQLYDVEERGEQLFVRSLISYGLGRVLKQFAGRSTNQTLSSKKVSFPLRRILALDILESVAGRMAAFLT